MFTEDELKQLENGYSVSETDGDDLMSMRSGGSQGLGSINSPATDGLEWHRH
jgi:hypothetical protein